MSTNKKKNNPAHPADHGPRDHHPPLSIRPTAAGSKDEGWIKQASVSLRSRSGRKLVIFHSN